MDTVRIRPIQWRSALTLLVMMLPRLAAAQQVLPPASERFEDSDVEEVPDFQKHIVPLLGRLGCNSAKCHGAFQGQAGFRLSLFGYDFAADHAALHAEASWESVPRVKPGDGSDSLLIRKATEQIEHGGGQRLKTGSWEHDLLVRWISAGSPGAGTTESGAAENDEDTEAAEFFTERILPLLEDNCYECHGVDAQKANLSLVSREDMLTGGDSGPAIVPGDPESSLMIVATQYIEEDLSMPPSGPLDDDLIADLEQWIADGAVWPDDDAVTPSRPLQVLSELRVEPPEILFTPRISKDRVKVIAVWQDGTREDVTCLARFQTNDDLVATIDRDGLVESVGPGDTHVVAFYDNGVAAVPVIRPYRESVAVTTQTASESAIDRFVNQKLARLGLTPSEPCSDAEFLRRVSIDMTGTLPSPAEVTAFLADESSDKRLRKIDELLGRPSYAAWWTNKLCDFTGCNPASISSLLEVAREDGYVKASEWYDWIYDRVATNVAYDDLVEGIMLADLAGGDGMPHFWQRQSLKEPRDTAMSVAHSFLGVQLQCAECHKHPFDRWTQSDFNDFARFFKPLTGRRAEPSMDEDAELRLLGSGVVALRSGDDPRAPIMEWMREEDNPWFARAFVNRVWAGYFHRGIVDPPDQFTPANPPGNAPLLEWLTAGFVEHGYDMKWLHRQIAASQTYQRSWKPNDTNRDDHRNFSRAIPRRIPAEVVYDALKQVTAATDQLEDVRTNLRRRASGHLSMRMAGTHAMKVFGKPDRAVNCDCERVNEPTLLQSIFVQNDPLVMLRLAESGWLDEIDESVAQGKTLSADELIAEVWLRTVSRPPSREEADRAARHVAVAESLTEGLRDLMWAMLNTKEFLLNH